MLGFARNIVFFRVSGASGAVKSRLASATVFGVAALAWKCSRTVRAVQLMVPGDFFFSLMMLCYCVLHVFRHFLHWNCCVEDMCSHLQLLEFDGSITVKLRFHIFNCSNLKDASHESCVFVSSTLGI